MIMSLYLSSSIEIIRDLAKGESTWRNLHFGATKETNISRPWRRNKSIQDSCLHALRIRWSTSPRFQSYNVDDIMLDSLVNHILS